MANFDRKNQPIEEKPRLTNVQRLMDIANNRKDNGIKHPIGLPEHPQEIAKTWINFVEPRMKYEIATENVDPYQERLANTLADFYKLSHADQRYIVELRSKDIYWRGDSVEFMKIREKVDMNKIDKSKLFAMMKTVIIRSKEVTTRKQHNCCWCGEIIEKGENAMYRVYKLDGDLVADHMHPECNDASIEVASNEGCSIEWKAGDYPRGSTEPY